MAAHTLGKVYVEHDGDGHESNHEFYVVISGGGGRICTMETPGGGTWKERKANAERLAACWNACEGLTLEQIERLGVALHDEGVITETLRRVLDTGATTPL